MKAMLITGDALAWSPVADPVPLAHEVVIGIRAAGVNRADLMQRAGTYPSPAGWPAWMGLEVAGVISHAPAGSRWKPGDRVCALLGGGGYAERVAVPAELVLPMPDGLSFDEAAALPEAYATSYLNLCLEGGMKAGDTVFIQAGASGLGAAAIQLAKSMGARVVTTVGSEEKRRFVADLGADVIINHRTTEIAAVLAEHPVDIAMDCVAGPGLGACLTRMKRNGRWIVIATLAGATAQIDVEDLFRKGIRLIGSTLRAQPLQTKAAILAGLERTVWPLLAAGSVRPALHRALPIADAEEAHRLLRTGANMGKVVLTLPAPESR